MLVQIDLRQHMFILMHHLIYGELSVLCIIVSSLLKRIYTVDRHIFFSYVVDENTPLERLIF